MCSQSLNSESILCPHCDLLLTYPRLHSGAKAVCPRCHTTLCQKRQAQPQWHATVIALSALFMLLLANAYPFIDMEAAGITSQIDLLTIPLVLNQEGYPFLSAVFLIFVQLIPAFCMLVIPLLCFQVRLPYRLKLWMAKTVMLCKTWCMVEIFLAGVMVSFVKLIAYGDIGIGPSFIPYCLFCLLQIRALQYIDRRWLWQQIAPLPPLPATAKPGIMGIRQGLRSCACCTAILPADQRECPRCLTQGEARKSRSLQWTLSLLLTSVILYIPANLLPMMVTHALGSDMASTIMAGVIFLWQEGS
ncbi:MAG: PqiA/YebS family transporter subunit, partial [Enterobacteriaceae bacterium]